MDEENEGQNTLEEYIEGLRPEERESFKDLIHECLERKKLIKEYSEGAERSLHQLAKTVRLLRQELIQLDAVSRLCCELAKSVAERASPAMLEDPGIRLTLN
jgi:hypothetical protein